MASELEQRFEELADEFAERCQRGERPNLSEYTDKHPELADRIQRLFPLMVMMEEHQPDADPESDADTAASDALQLESLGDFRILREVGRGGMGIVYEAEQESLGRRVALKVLPSSATLSPQHLPRFAREAKSAARLHHTNIVPVFGVGEQDGLHYYVMQFIHGCGLDLVIDELRKLHHKMTPGEADEPSSASRSPQAGDVSAVDVAQSLLDGAVTVVPHVKTQPAALSGSSVDSVVLPGKTSLSDSSTLGSVYWKSVARVGVQVAEALQYAHRQGVLHRDVKPSNLLLDTQGTVWVTDFGLAKAVDSDDLTHTGDIVGTLRYLPPERFQGDGDERSDIYSLGLTLYELLTMRPAFNASGRNRLLQDIVQSEPPAPRRRSPEIPRDLETIVLKAIDREPGSRYAAAADLAADLNRFIANQPIQARRISFVERTGKWARRHPAVASLTGVIMLLLVAGFSAIFWQWREAESARDEAAQIAVAERFARQQAERQKTNALVAEKRAVELAEDERVARNAASRAQEAETEARRQLQMQLAELNSAYGIRMLEQQDLFGSLVWFAEARALDQQALQEEADPAHLEQARQRLATQDARVAAVLAQCPRLAQAWSMGQAVRHVEFSPDGRQLAVSAGNGDVRVWDPATGEPLTPPLPHPSHAWLARFSPDGRWIVTGCGDQKGRVWDAATGELVSVLHHGIEGVYTGVRWVAFSPDSQLVATASLDGFARVWEAESGQPVTPPMGGTRRYCSTVEFSPPGDRVITTSTDDTAKIWDISSGTLVLQIQHEDDVNRAIFSPDGRWVATCSRDGTARVWDADSGRPVSEPMRHGASIRDLAFSPAGDRIVTASYDRTARIWEAESGQPLGEPLKHFASVTRTHFSTDGRYVVTCSDDQTARVWLADSGEAATPYLRHATRVSCAQLSPRGDQLVTGAKSGAVRIWDLKAAIQPVHFAAAGPAQRASLSAEGRFLITIDGEQTVRVWDADSFAPHGQPLPHSAAVESVQLSANGMHLLSLDAAKKPRVWDVQTGQAAPYSIGGKAKTDRTMFSDDGRFVLFLYGDRFNLHDLALHRDVLSNRTLDRLYRELVGAVVDPRGKYVAVASTRLTKVWDTRTGALRFQLPPSGASMAASPDGRWLALSGVKTLLVDAASGEELAAIDGGSQAQSICFSPQSDRFLMIEPSGLVRVASVADVGGGPPDQVVLLHPDVVHAASFSQDGSRIATACEDGAARIWDARSGQLLSPEMRHSAAMLQAQFDHHDRRLMTHSSDGVVKFWDLPDRDVKLPGDLELLGAVLAMQRQTESGLQRLSVESFVDAWQQLRECGAEFATPGPQQWHRRELANSLAEGNWFAAELHLTQLIDAEPDDVQWRLQRGQVRLRRGAADAAEDDFAAALELGGADVDARRQLARAHFRSGQHRQAARRLQQALALGSRPPLEEGVDGVELPPADRQVDPTSGSLWLMLSCAYSALGETDQSAAAYARALPATQAIKLNPTTTWQSRSQGLPVTAHQTWQEALEDIEQLEDKLPAWQTWRARGLVAAAAGDYPAAAEAWARAAELQPDQADIWTALARARSEQAAQSREPQQARDAWTEVADCCAKAAELSEGDWTTMSLAAGAALALGQWELAVDHASRAIELAPEAFELHHLRGMARRRLRLPEALDDFSRAMSRGANLAQMFYERGLTYLQLGQPREAEQELAEAIQLGWNPPLSHYYRGVALARLNDLDAALAALDQAIEAGRPSTGMHLMRGSLRLRKRQFAEAEADLSFAAKYSTFDAPDGHLPVKTQAHAMLVAARAQQQKWDAALSALRVLDARPEYRQQAAYETALIELAAGRPEQYARRCREFLEMAGDESDQRWLTAAGWICALGPAAAGGDELLQQVEQAARDHPDDKTLQRTLGALLYRAGKHGAALKQLQDLNPEGGTGTVDLVFMSMAQHQLGNAEQAAQLLEQAQQRRTEDSDGSSQWIRRLELDLLLDEAANLQE